MIELVLIGALDLAVELRGTWLDVDVADALVFKVPMELGLELMPIVGSHFADTEGELFDDMVDERDSAGLRVGLIDFEGPDAGGIIDVCVLISFDGFVVFALESQKLNINLDLLTRYLFLVRLGVDFAQFCAARQPADANALEDAINARTRYFDIVVAGQI